MNKNRARQLSFYLFFGLMIFAKGIGLDSGDKLYYVLSAAACACMGAKLILTKYNKKQMTAMILLGLIAFAAYWNSGRMGILLSALTIIGLKDMDVKKLFRLGAVIYGVSFFATILMAKTGIISNPLVVHEKGGMEIIRWGMGYSTGNVFHISYFILTVFLCYTWGKNYSWKKLLGLMAGNFLVFLFSLSYTGIAVTAFYLFLNMYAVKRKHLSLTEKILCQLPLPLCLVFSFGTPFLMQYPFGEKINQILNGRPAFSAYYLENQPITLLGGRMKDIPNFWVIMDNAYVYIFMTFGIVTFVLFCLGYAVLIARYSKENRLSELAMIFSFLLYGIMEQFLSNAFMNVSLLFMGEVLFGSRQEESRKIQEEEKGKLISPILEKIAEKGKDFWESCEKVLENPMRRRIALLAGGLAGTAVLTLYLTAAPMLQYVKVPLKSLNYVDAEHVLVHIENKEGTKDFLKEQMQLLKEQMQKAETAEQVIITVGMEKRLTPEELAEALEFGIPISVHSGDSYDMFRVRLLKLYDDIGQEEYCALLEELVRTAMENIKRQNIENTIVAVDAAAEERIGKDFGTDRIEHMSFDHEYFVEKSGEIPKMEYIRDALFWTIVSAEIGYLLALVLQKRKSLAVTEMH